MDNQKEQLSKLIGRYEDLTAAERKKYNEANTRKNFILPLFDILGWNIRSDDVSEEEQASGKRVDYAFKINGLTKFFLEAKSLSADLDEIRWSEQAIWYAYHKSVPWVILTNFEKIKVFNAEWDSPEPETSLFFELKYTDYLENFEKLLLLSRESVENGELDKKALEWGKKPKTVSTVGERLTEDLLNWRDNLFNDLIGYNPNIKKEAAADSVQKFINRLIFIRTCEDRGLEQKRLLGVLRAWEDGGKKDNDLVKRIRALFFEFNDNYDSKLFEDKIIFDSDSNKLIFEESVIAKIIEETYKNSRGIRWNFNDINADVLGSVYEQYLGQIQSGKANKEEKKLSKRKSQGIYYTPRYIVDYIVKNTLGEALKDKNFNEILKLKVLDPACGSGSFLIRAFEEALSHLRKETGKINRDFDDYALRWSVLTSMIYGVDLDQEAVEITQLNLLLKTLGKREKLPNLSNKIDCGNSLISGTEEELKKYFGKNWKDKKPFNWEERFTEVFKQGQGGFDVIIGNPPYVNLANIKSEEDREWLKNNYETAKNKSDLYSFFIERSIKLLKDGGILGFIVSNSWLGTDSFSKFREYLIKNTKVLKLVKLSLGVFADATVTPVLIILKKEKIAKNHKIDLMEYKNDKFIDIPNKLDYERIMNSPNFNFSFSSEISFSVSTTKLGEMAKFSLGIKTSDDERFIVNNKKDKDSYPLLRGKDVGRYFYKYANKWLWYKPELMMEKVGAGPRRLEYFLKEKILFKDVAVEICATFDKENYLSNDTLSLIYEAGEYNLRFILALLNSKFVNYWYLTNYQSGLHIKINELQNIPIPKIDFSNKHEKQKHDELVKLADKMLELNKKLQKINPILDEEEHKELKSEIDKTDKEIDEKVYKLYDLTPEEIKIVEGSIK